MSTDTNLRQRFGKKNKFHPGARRSIGDRNISSTSDNKSVRKLGVLHWLLIIGSFAVFYIIQYYKQHYSFPEPIPANDNSQVSEERIRDYLAGLTDLGYRFVGTPANEVLAVKYIMEKLKNIQEGGSSHLPNGVNIDLQLASGTYDLEFLGTFSSHYTNIQNIIVKVGPEQPLYNDTFMVNCHFDSVVDSPGGSDDGASCAISLEMIHLFSLRPEAMKRPIIFVFNGAEENILQGSHAFITQHPWRHSIVAFVNLEGAGAGGREVLFQAGHNSPWLIQAFANSVPHSFASSVGQEVFESGLIPSTTDFLIFNDFGNIPGLDLAYISNGYVYHTKYDDLQRIPRGCLQRSGENMYALVLHLAEENMALGSQGSSSKIIYFDFVGVKIVMFSVRAASVLGCGLLLFLLLDLYLSARNSEKSFSHTACDLLLAVIGQVVIVAGALISTVALGYVMDVAGPLLSWYNHQVNLIGMYVLPAVGVTLILGSFLSDALAYYRQLPIVRVQSLLWESAVLLWGLVAAVLCFFGSASCYLPMAFVLFPLVVRRVMSVVCGNDESLSVRFCLFRLFLSLLIPAVLSSGVILGCFELFVPLMGRVGPTVPSDVVIATFCGLFVVLLASFPVSLLAITSKRNVRVVASLFFILSLVTYAAVSFTEWGFPYNTDEIQPRKQRQLVQHVDRVLRNEDNRVVSNESFILWIPMDRYGFDSLREHAPALHTWTSTASDHTCLDLPYCGVPFLYPIANMLTKLLKIPSKGHIIVPQEERSSLTLIRRSSLSDNILRLEFLLNSSDHANLYVREVNDAILKRWSIGDGSPNLNALHPKSYSKREYFAYISYGTKPSVPFTLWMEVQVPIDYKNGSVLEVGVSAHYTHGKFRFSPDIVRIKEAMPAWTIPIFWSVTYDSYVF